MSDSYMKKMMRKSFSWSQITTYLFFTSLLSVSPVMAESAHTWQQQGQQALKKALALNAKATRAKNVILFIGDGMGVSTITAARIFAGQAQGLNGEGYQLAFEQFPYLALSKTYSANQQTPDSAPTMSAMMTGVKTNSGVLSVNQSVKPKIKDNQIIQQASMETLLEAAEKKGISTGIVSTARITHATPAASYAHTSYRNWEADSDLPKGTAIKDIAAQLLNHQIEVVFGGGRQQFLPNTEHDPEYPDKKGVRLDKRHLIHEYQNKYGAQYIWNKAQFDALSSKQTQPVIGLFEPSHMRYEADRKHDGAGEPSLAEMTTKAIELLSQNNRGYFLVVEAGRIDHAHHAGNAYRALSETVMLDKAVAAALSKTHQDETLIIVTADHSHTFVISGYPARGNPILGKVKPVGEHGYVDAYDGKPYTTLGYINGRGFHAHHDGQSPDDYHHLPNPGRPADLSQIDTTLPNYHQEAGVPLESETHAGEDVPIYAIGPQAHLFHGTQEQTYLYYVMQYALGLDK